jgi:CRP/FNR family transcriptional regulator, cyclic AMP receptor protein
MKFKILIVEDNEPIRENTIELLELSNYEVIAACNGREGLEKAVQCKPDLILCDIQMPLMNGYHLLEQVRNIAAFETTRFLFFSASTEKKDIEKGLLMGANDYILKPFSGEDLLEKLKSQLPQE